ncbi:hypothetical protein SRCM100623_00258 [Acetobacter pasteurianus]|uniref:Uncharacterized protein n=1 Tax=Acetobacter pasteurianus TaxID=438 RepID=A0A1A0DNY5_ACEPA|nr:hypothetical protein [Acetobacter pasteurianus]OAZ76397.1 hypothetical protein SRCM100623_00258 [Acetobacter pasteurianus]
MRARKEQVSALACALFNKHTDIDECIAIANKYIQEAEERAEQRIRSEIEANLKDQSTVHVNMLRGSIATPTWDQFLHLFPGKKAECAADTRRLEWLAECVSSIGGRRGEPLTWQIMFFSRSGVTDPKEIRAAIDAAMEGGNG